MCRIVAAGAGSRVVGGDEIAGAERSAGAGDRTCELAKLFAERLRAAGYEVLNDVVINQALVSFGVQRRRGK